MMPFTKTLATKILGVSSTFAISRLISRRIAGGKQVFIPNYHATHLRDAESFQRQVETIQQHFTLLRFEQIEEFLNSDNPEMQDGLVFTFDDGLWSNYAVAAPILEKAGTRGLFLLPVQFIDGPTCQDKYEEIKRAAGFSIKLDADNLDAQPTCRATMNWDEVRELKARGHAIGCHGWSHRRLSDELSKDELSLEIDRAKTKIENELGAPVDIFCWIGGETWAYSQCAAQRIRDAGFRYGLMTGCAPVGKNTDRMNWHRFNLEADMNIKQIRLILGGGYQLLYFQKRNYVNKVTKTE